MLYSWTTLAQSVLLFVIIFTLCSLCDCGELHFCSFFNNRKPTPQPGLRNCTWFQANSCCKQEEIEATFGTVKPLAGSSPECQRYTNYLMCYICAPYQNIFYGQERLTVCEEFCNAWYNACSSAILKGSVIGALYKSGREFCLKRNFQCERTVENQRCFTVPQDLDISNGAATIQSNIWTPLLIGHFIFIFLVSTFSMDIHSTFLGLAIHRRTV